MSGLCFELDHDAKSGSGRFGRRWASAVTPEHARLEQRRLGLLSVGRCCLMLVAGIWCGGEVMAQSEQGWSWQAGQRESTAPSTPPREGRDRQSWGGQSQSPYAAGYLDAAPGQPEAHWSPGDGANGAWQTGSPRLDFNRSNRSPTGWSNAPGTQGPVYRFRGDPIPHSNGRDWSSPNQGEQYRFRPLTAKERERPGPGPQWRPRNIERETPAPPDLFDFMSPGNRPRDHAIQDWHRR